MLSTPGCALCTQYWRSVRRGIRGAELVTCWSADGLGTAYFVANSQRLNPAFYLRILHSIFTETTTALPLVLGPVPLVLRSSTEIKKRDAAGAGRERTQTGTAHTAAARGRRQRGRGPGLRPLRAYCCRQSLENELRVDAVRTERPLLRKWTLRAYSVHHSVHVWTLRTQRVHCCKSGRFSPTVAHSHSSHVDDVRAQRSL